MGLGSEGLYATGFNGNNSIALIAQATGSMNIWPNNGNSKYVFDNTSLRTGSNNLSSLGTALIRWSTVYSTNGTIQTSYARLKKNIRPIHYGLKDILALNSVVYDWKDSSGNDKVEFIAHELQEVIPNVVEGHEKKENLGINYAELVPVLTTAIQEQQK